MAALSARLRAAAWLRTTKVPAATISLTEEDLVSLAKGSESAQSLYQHGKLRVDGDIRLAHKLSFLKGLV